MLLMLHIGRDANTLFIGCPLLTILNLLWVYMIIKICFPHVTDTGVTAGSLWRPSQCNSKLTSRYLSS